MASAKDIQLRVIPANIANQFVRKHHYSGKVVNNSCLHFGAFLNGKLHGVMSYGPSLDKRKIIGLVEGTPWSGFLLTGIKENKNIAVMPDGTKLHKMTLESNPLKPLPQIGGRSYFDVTGGGRSWQKFLDAVGGHVQPGYQLRYIRFLDPAWEKRLTVPVIPFEKIDEIGAGMYRGEHVSVASRRTDVR